MKEEKKYSSILNSWSVPYKQSKEAAWDELQAKIGLDQEAKVININAKRRPVWYALAGAAMIALAALLFLNSDNSVEVNSGANALVHELPDGSTVTLNKYSSLRYEEDFAERALELKGEAFFEVKKGERFDVLTEEGKVSVLGTSFNVFSEDELFEVQCYTGKVGVNLNAKGADDRILTPGQETKKSGILLTASSQFKGDAPLWMNGYAFDYENVYLKKVVKDLERRFDVNIEVSGISTETFTGTFETADIEIALKTICLPYGLDFQMESPKKVIIFKK
ncbi:MAG: FecR domain-containing protein [Flavobacteriales bacterium]|nr:FecR domain-containing protein [Flavobacteriales bacterium]